MRDLLTNDAFLGLVGGLGGAFLTYLGIAKKQDSNVANLYAKEIRGVINDLKEENEKKDREIEQLEALVEQLKQQLEKALHLVDKIQEERKLAQLEVEKKNKQISQLSEIVKALREK